MNENTSVKSNQMNFFIILRDILRNALFIFMAAVIGFLSVTIYIRYVRQPIYTSSSTLVVTAKNTTYANAYAALSTASSMAGVLKEVFESDIIMQKVKDDTGPLPEIFRFPPMLSQERTFLYLTLLPMILRRHISSAIQYLKITMEFPIISFQMRFLKPSPSRKFRQKQPILLICRCIEFLLQWRWLLSLLP